MNNKILSTIILVLAIFTFSCKSTDAGNVKEDVTVNFPEMILEANQDFSSCVGDWKLVLFVKDGVAQTIAVADLSIAVDDDDTFNISGTLGENLFTGVVTLGEPNVLEVVSFGSTKMAVPPELAEFEYLYSELLSSADSYSVGKFPNESFITLEIRSSTADSFAHFVRK